MSHVETGRSASLAHRYAPDLVAEDSDEQPITVDQTNESVIVGGVVVVKWLRPPVPEPHPGVRVLRHLSAVGFDEMPRFLGTHAVAGRVEAMLTEYVPGAVDGWAWYVDDLSEALDHGSASAVIATAGSLGALAARLHDALATPSSEIEQPVSGGVVRAELERGFGLLAEARRSTAGEAGLRLVAHANRIDGVLLSVDPETPIAVQPIHGDLHVGQVLRTRGAAADRMVLTDFDGNPVMDASERHALRSPLVDLASLLQSIDHVGRLVAKRRPDLVAATDSFIVDAVAAALGAYILARPMSASDRAVLRALQVVQELHEYVYAARSLPAWLYVPDAALAALFR